MEEKDKPLFDSKSDVAKREEKILKYWQDNKIFEKSLEQSGKEGNFVFFDGPPFATGTPHYGHILAGTIKDIIPRYQTMRGKKVERRWGWDCHGLPIENLVEKELGLSSKKDIEVYGVEKFNRASRGTVMRYADEWKKVIPRVGRWVDMENDYKTMDSSYTESVWWSFKNLYDKGLVYKSFKSMHICPHCETTLSNFEINQGYKDITDLSVYVKFRVKSEKLKVESGEEENTYFLAWTTTPWTLPGNVALAVNKDSQYIKAKKNEEVLILAKDLAKKVLKENYEILEEFSGEEIIGKNYIPLFPYYNNEELENRENGFKVYHGDFVTMEDGTGIVHIAPAFGEDDMNLGKEKKLPFISHVAMDGTFKKEVVDFAGLEVKPKGDHQKTDIEIIKYLAKNGTLFEKEKLIHSYPHCWRCESPLLNYATTSWFVKVTDIKDKMLELNSKISWYPKEIGEGRFGKWIEGARDWAISRSRYWGAPLPVWQNEKGENFVIGSVADLKERIGKRNNYFIMRHGESEGNIAGDKISSKKENQDNLTSNGREEVLASSKDLLSKNINVIYSSPFLRTKQTAEIVAENVGLSKEDIIFDERLKEIDAGEFEGKTWSEFFLRFKNLEERFTKKIDGEENLLGVYKRVMDFMYDIDKKHQGKNVLVITHGAPAMFIDAGSLSWQMKKIMKDYWDLSFFNAEWRETPFVSVPHNEIYEFDLHRPYIDKVVLTSEKGEVLKRVPEVFDTWYDSGSMPFAQVHYPFENKEEFEKNLPAGEAGGSLLYPADFIAEGLDQTRGWFYTLLVLSTGLFGKSPYNNVIVNGLVLAEDGRKMSKSLKNYPDLSYIIDKYGADAMRYYMISSPIVRAEDLNFSEKGVDEVYKKIVQKLYNVLSFYEMYPVSKEGKVKETVLDRWIVSRLNSLLETVTVSLDHYELDKASRPIMDFVDDLSTWYIRRSRERLKSSDLDVSYTASYYLKFVLGELSKIIAPFMPFLAEEVYRRVGREKESVHLESWPESFGKVDKKIEEDMTKVREVVTAVLELRQKAGMKVRQPLQSVKVKSKKFESEYEEILKDELNVKEIIFSDSLETEVWLDTNLTEELKDEGIAREIIRAIQDIRKTEKLNPSERISQIVNAPDDIKKVFNDYSIMINGATGTTTTIFSSEIQDNEIILGDKKISISIK